MLASHIVVLVEEDDGGPEDQTCEQAAYEAHLVKENNPFPVVWGLHVRRVNLVFNVVYNVAIPCLSQVSNCKILDFPWCFNLNIGHQRVQNRCPVQSPFWKILYTVPLRYDQNRECLSEQGHRDKDPYPHQNAIIDERRGFAVLKLREIPLILPDKIVDGSTATAHFK